MVVLATSCTAPIYEGVGSETTGNTTNESETPTSEMPGTGDSSSTGSNEITGDVTSNVATDVDTTSAETTVTTNPDTESTGPDTMDETGPSVPVCNRPIDVAFVISRNTGMPEFQDRMRGAVAGLFEHLAADDLRVMVVRSDLVWGAEKCEDTLCPENENDSCAPLDETYKCGLSPEACDVSYGAGTPFPLGIGAANGLCAATRYTDNVSEAECMLLVGEATKSNDLGHSIIGLVTPETNIGCNEGFLRDNSALVVVILSELDDNSLSQPQGWIADFAKHRDPNSTMVVAYLGPDAMGGDINTFIESFAHSAVTPIDADSYNLSSLMLDEICR